ncbi:MAG: hypothetical protein IH941_07190 [Acidobacteria bacterium]|nr:hypothetical protein [Acidobacteriota bacterium]
MTLLLREVGRFLGGAIAWVGLELVIAATVGMIAGHLLQLDRVRTVGFCFLGGVLAAALAMRLSVPLAWAPIVGGRPLPVVWSGLGAVAAVVVTIASGRKATAHP